MSTKRTFLVTGATGKQGRAVIRALLASPAATTPQGSPAITIHALTRSASSPAAQNLLALAPTTISLLEGNLDDVPAIFAQLPPALDGVFSVQTMSGPGVEEAQGKALVDAALRHGAKHFVYSSVDRGGARSDTDPTPVPHFASKHAIEQHLETAAAGTPMSWTILRPVFFMDNLTPDFTGRLIAAGWKVYLGRARRLQLVATSDIGHFAARALLDPAAHAGEKISLAGDEMSFAEANAVFKMKFAREIPRTWDFVPMTMFKLAREFGIMFTWLDTDGYGADIEALRKVHPGLKGFGEWLETESVFEK